MRKKFYNCFNWLHQNIRLCNGVLIVIILIRFALLNYVNWSWGLLTSGYGGVQFGADAYRYIDGAEHLLNNIPFEGAEVRYPGYIVLIAFVKMLGAGLEMALVIQLLLALLSSLALFDLGKSITGNTTAGIVAAGLYLSNPFITSWHLYIHTESLYFSFLIISTWTISKAIEKHHYKYYILSFVIVCITASVRPNGWVLFPIMLYFFIRYSNFKRYFKYAAVFMVISMFFLSAAYIPAFNRAIQNFPAVEMLLKGGVIWGCDEVNINMPKDTSMGEKSWTSAYSYIAKHPLACIKLAMYRVALELFPVRPWQSVKFKIRLLIWILPAYILAVFGIISYKRKSAFKIALVIVLAHIFVISLIPADYEFRFLLYILPLVYLLCACGLLFVYKKCESRVGRYYK